MQSPLKDAAVNPVEYVKVMFPGWRFIAIAAVEALQHFVRLDESKVEQALRSSPVIGKERVIVARDIPAPEPLNDEPPVVDELPDTGPVEADGALESPDSEESYEEDFEDFEDFEDDDEEEMEDEEYTDEEPSPEPTPTPNKPMNKSKLNAAVTAAFAAFTTALTKALKTINIALNLSPDNKELSTVTADGVVAASFRIQRFPGCDPILIVSKFSITEAFRNSGLNRTLHQVLEAAAKNAGATGVLATVRQDNQIQNVILEFTGWTPIQSFTNPKTGAGVQLYYKEVSA